LKKIIKYNIYQGYSGFWFYIIKYFIVLSATALISFFGLNAYDVTKGLVWWAIAGFFLSFVYLYTTIYFVFKKIL